MNILFLMGVYPSFGGVEKVSTVLANAFHEKGYGVSLVSFEQPFPDIAEKELHPSINLYKLEYPVRLKKNIDVLHHIIESEHIDIIINQWSLPWYVARLCKKAMCGSRCKLISVYHNIPNTNARIKAIELDIESDKGSRFLNLLKLKIVTFASRLSLLYTVFMSDKMVVLSQSFIDILVRFVFGFGKEITFSIPNPLTISGSERYDDKDKTNEIIYVGRIEYNQKRTFRLVEVWKVLEPMFPNWRFTIVGDGPDAEDLRQKILNAGLQRMNITGYQNPLLYYKRAEILTLVSEYEGFPLVLCEAMSNGCIPVVLGSYPAAYDIVKPSTGIVMPYPYKEDEFIDVLSQLMQNKERRVAMAKKGIIESNRFNLHSIINEWQELFDTL